MTLTNTTGPNDAIIQASTDDGSSWTDISDFVVSITPDAWARAFGSTQTHGSDESYQKAGKLLPTTVTLNWLYTDGEITDLIDTMWTQHTTADGGQYMVQISYDGTSSGKRKLTTNTDAKIESMTPPPSDSTSPTPHAGQTVVTTTGWDKGTH